MHVCLLSIDHSNVTIKPTRKFLSETMVSSDFSLVYSFEYSKGGGAGLLATERDVSKTIYSLMTLY